MKQQFLTAIHALSALAAAFAATAASAQDARVELVTSDGNGVTYYSTAGFGDSIFADTASGFAVGGTSPNFGGSAMTTASSTSHLHSAQAVLVYSFTLPTFITSSRITLDFKGHAFSTGNAMAEIGYSILKFGRDGIFAVGAGGVASTELTGWGGKVGGASLSATESFVLAGGESFQLKTFAIAETGFTEGGYGFFTRSPGPGYATAFMDPIVTVAAAVPEPATWALLIAGFGMVGVSARRRRRTNVINALVRSN